MKNPWKLLEEMSILRSSDPKEMVFGMMPVNHLSSSLHLNGLKDFHEICYVRIY